MYSTKHIEVEALPVVRRAQNKCRRVTTPRERVYPTGKIVVDEVFAVYRPKQGLNCNGEPSDPNAIPPTTAPPVTQPPTTAPPVTEPATTTTTLATEPPTSTTTTEPEPPPTTEPVVDPPIEG